MYPSQCKYILTSNMTIYISCWSILFIFTALLCYKRKHNRVATVVREATVLQFKGSMLMRKCALNPMSGILLDSVRLEDQGKYTPSTNFGLGSSVSSSSPSSAGATILTPIVSCFLSQ